MKKNFTLLTFILLFGLLLAACGGNTAINNAANTDDNNNVAEAAAPVVEEEPMVYDEPFEIIGSFEYSNSIITDYYSQHAVALIDMHAFVIRDVEWKIPVASQTLGYLNIDMDAMTAEYIIQLPVMPTGTFSDVDNDGVDETGVQVFVTAYWPNLYAGPYSVGDDESSGWPAYLASIVADTENDDEIIGGKLVVWSPDDAQDFPTGFGDDGLLFTADDPSGPIPAGYTIVDLDAEPFEFIKEARPDLTLLEPQDVAIKDFSEMSYTESFDAMFDIVRVEYAFNGIDGKQPDWDALYAELQPRVAKAETDNDPEAYYFALRDFTWAFKDGHVGLGGGVDIFRPVFDADTEGDYGFAVRELDDGRTMVFFITEEGPAALAGMELGAEITKFNGQPIADAIGETSTWTLPHSSDFSLRYQQPRYLLADPAGTEVTITFTNPEDDIAQTVTLTAVKDPNKTVFSRTSVYYGVDTQYMLPVEFDILTEGNAVIGYVRINSNYDDLNLIITLFERALQTFEAYEVEGIIIDMRVNGGGANLGLAGLLTDIEIPMGQLEYYSETTGEFEAEGLPGKVIPNENQYRFGKVVLLVNQTCASACELESYGFSQIPGAIVVGQYPTGGIEAEVARGQFTMPDDLFLQIPTGRFTLPDGSIFLEGVGVEPTLRVPIDETTIFAEGDIVLEYGIRAVLAPSGAGIVPDSPPTVESRKFNAEKALLGDADFIEDKARNEYTLEELEIPGSFIYDVVLTSSQDISIVYGWCASTDKFDQNWEHIIVEFSIEGEAIPAESVHTFDYPYEDLSCRVLYIILSDWAGGEHHLNMTTTFDAKINDGDADYAAGVWTYDYTVYVTP